MTAITLGAAVLQAGKGGLARLARLTAKALVQYGHDVSALAFLDDTDPGLAGVPTHLCAGSKIDYVTRLHREAVRSDLLMFNAVGMARPRPRLPGLRRPYAVWMSGLEAWESLRPSGRAIYEGAAVVLSVSQYSLDRYETLHGPLHNADVCWPSTDEDDLPNVREKPGNAPPTALILGRVELCGQDKGHFHLVRIWPEVCARVPDARLVVVGEGGGLEALRAAVARSPVGDRIEVFGFVPDVDMPEIWSRTDVFTMPCRGGGFGIVYAEAMRYGLPVVASTNDAAVEVNIDGATGFNVDLANLPGLVDALARLLENRELARRMGAAGLARWKMHFRFSSFAERLERTLVMRGLSAPYNNGQAAA